MLAEPGSSAVVFFRITAAGWLRDRVLAHPVVCSRRRFTERLGQPSPPTDTKIIVIDVVRQRENIRERESQKLLPINQPKVFVGSDRISEELSFIYFQDDFSVPAACIGRHAGT